MIEIKGKNLTKEYKNLTSYYKNLSKKSFFKTLLVGRNFKGNFRKNLMNPDYQSKDVLYLVHLLGQGNEELGILFYFIIKRNYQNFKSYANLQ
jgi:Ran GTPase-activating protein (RanGAP) involved in mRNA processing and transport